jgi:hypothetical protein
LKQNGARHRIDGKLFLGATVDGEKDGLPSLDSLGDDLSGKPDDEDGVWFASSLVPGMFATIIVESSLPGYLDAWIDFAHDGSWDQEKDQILASRRLDQGFNILAVRVPPALEGATYSRFRLSSDGGLRPIGEAHEGEVEDHLVPICLKLAASIRTDKLAYRVGEKQVITFFLSEDSDVTLVQHGADGTLTVLGALRMAAGTHDYAGSTLAPLAVASPAGTQWVELKVAGLVSGCTTVVATPFRVVQ